VVLPENNPYAVPEGSSYNSKYQMLKKQMDRKTEMAFT